MSEEIEILREARRILARPESWLQARSRRWRGPVVHHWRHRAGEPSREGMARFGSGATADRSLRCAVPPRADGRAKREAGDVLALLDRALTAAT